MFVPQGQAFKKKQGSKWPRGTEGKEHCLRESLRSSAGAILWLLIWTSSLKLHQLGALVCPHHSPHPFLCHLTKPQIRKDQGLFQGKPAKERSQNTALGAPDRPPRRGAQLPPRALSPRAQRSWFLPGAYPEGTHSSRCRSRARSHPHTPRSLLSPSTPDPVLSTRVSLEEGRQALSLWPRTHRAVQGIRSPLVSTFGC